MREFQALTDTEALALTLVGEAANQGLDGMAAVANTIANRVHADLHGDNKPDWWGEGFRAVCLQNEQFSCWNAGTASRARLLALPADTASLQDAHVLARAAIDGTLRDRTRGATHYYAPKLMGTPAWARGRLPVARLGDHVFYRVLD